MLYLPITIVIYIYISIYLLLLNFTLLIFKITEKESSKSGRGVSFGNN